MADWLFLQAKRFHLYVIGVPDQALYLKNARSLFIRFKKPVFLCVYSPKE